MKNLIIFGAVLIFLFVGVIAITSFRNARVIGISAYAVSNAEILENFDKLTLKVNIPCPGHAGLIKYELEKLEGVKQVSFRNPNLFDVYYDNNKTSKNEITELGIFKEYPAQEVN